MSILPSSKQDFISMAYCGVGVTGTDVADVDSVLPVGLIVEILKGVVGVVVTFTVINFGSIGGGSGKSITYDRQFGSEYGFAHV